MSGNRGTETTFELTTIERLEQQDYKHLLGPELERPHDEVVLKDLLRSNLAERYPELPLSALDEAEPTRRPDGVDTLRRNMAFHQSLARASRCTSSGRTAAQDRHVHPIDWDHPNRNAFLGRQPASHRRPERPPAGHRHLRQRPAARGLRAEEPVSDDSRPSTTRSTRSSTTGTTFPQLFEFNALCVVSDGVTTRSTACGRRRMEWYAPWKSIDGDQIEPARPAEGARRGPVSEGAAAAYIRDFIAVRGRQRQDHQEGRQVPPVLRRARGGRDGTLATSPGDDRRIGVIWHTTGSGKSLSMALPGRHPAPHPGAGEPVVRHPGGPHRPRRPALRPVRVAGRLVGEVKHAERVDELRDLLGPRAAR